MKPYFNFLQTALPYKHLYQPLGDGNFLIKSSNIFVDKKIITLNKPYLLLNQDPNGLQHIVVKMLDVNLKSKGKLIFLLQTLLSQTNLQFECDIKKPNSHCSWFLLDAVYSQELAKAIEPNGMEEYCQSNH